MNCVKEFPILNSSLQEKIYSFISLDNREMNDSQLYSTESNSLLIDKELRSSKY